MNELLTPKQVSRAIDVSESSVKRWCDKGLIATRYTVGGHRRILLSGLIDFLRQSKHQLVHPDVLGLPALTAGAGEIDEQTIRRLTSALLDGDESVARRVTFDLFLGNCPISAICDDVFRPVFQEIGARWECGNAEVYQERRGCEIALRVLHELLGVTAPPPERAPLAIGGSIAGDQYSLATTMVELVLRRQHWHAVSLGGNLPFATLSAAIAEHRPRLFWLSCSHIEDKQAFVAGYRGLYEAHGDEVPFVVGGRALVEPIRQQIQYAAYCDTMRHLESFVHTLPATGPT
ncbi:MAG: helix-turn-helix domain-containing protein [Pirellulales bacterium]